MTDASMHISLTYDEFGLPTVSWTEPRREKGLLGWRLRVYEGKCWVALEGGTYRPMFAQSCSTDSDDIRAVPLEDVAGFSVPNARELLQPGSQPLPTGEKWHYRDELMVVADLRRPPAPGAPPIMPLALTCASRAAVMALHAALLEEFIHKAPNLQRAIAACQQKKAGGMREHAQASMVLPPIIFGGRKFVALVRASEREQQANDPPAKTGIFHTQVHQDISKNAFRSIAYLHSFVRPMGKDIQIWSSSNILWFPADPAYPDLMGITYCTASGVFVGHKFRKQFKQVRLFHGDELKLPPAYLTTPDAVLNNTILILCIEFDDGELMPLTHSPCLPGTEKQEPWASFQAHIARACAMECGSGLVI